MNAPNREQLKPRHAKGQAANVNNSGSRRPDTGETEAVKTNLENTTASKNGGCFLFAPTVEVGSPCSDADI
jgi:hypothetical protein